MSGGVMLVLWIFWTVAFLMLYHKFFAVYYFDVGLGVLKELVMACIFGLAMAVVTVAFWYISAAVIVIVGLVIMSKTQSKIPLGIAIVLAIIVSVVGISLKADSKSIDGNQSSIDNGAEQNQIFSGVNERGKLG